MKKFICLFALVFYPIVTMAGDLLYPQERVMTFAQAQTLTYFQNGDKQKPLVIFIPGDSHLARIAYGYPQGQEKDFLAYWLHERGYPFLALSYPLANPVYTRTYPAFNIHQWGEQIADAAEYFIKKNGLSNKIVVLGWSMGGSVEQSVYAAAKKRGLDLEVFVGLAAVPPLPFIMQSGSFDTSVINKNLLAKRDQLIPWFIEQLSAQNKYNGHTIIPETIYKKEFIGDIPTALAAEGYHLKNNRFLKDTQFTYQDSGVFQFANTPWIALIVDNAQADAKISAIDPFSWNFIRAEMVYQRYIRAGVSAKQWETIKELIKKMPEQLTLTVDGTHFFFVGEQGAKATVTQMELLIQRVKELKEALEQK